MNAVGDRAGEVLAGRFELMAHLGSGGMGSVYRAHDRRLDDEVAVKLLHPDVVATSETLELLRSEVKLARRVTSTHVARIHELVDDRDQWFLTMEYIDGVSLADVMRGGRLPVARIVELLAAVCDGLSAVHAAGVVHGDVKPANILVARDGRVVLTDFGVARFSGARSDSREVVGTPAYMAPEQVTGEPLDARTDVYALGVVGYELMAGDLPFRGRNAIEVATARLFCDAPGLGDDLPAALSAAIASALAREPERRPVSAIELRDALVAAPAGERRGIESIDVVELYLEAQRVYRHFARASQAVAMFAEARRRAPDSAVVQAGYAVALTRKWMMVGVDREGLAAEAMIAADRAAELAPHIGEAQFARGVLALHTGDPAGAARQLRVAVTRAPGLADAHAMAVMLLLEIDRLDDAERAMRYATRLDPDLADLAAMRARALALKGDWREAEAIMRGDPEPGSVAMMIAARLAAYRRDNDTLERLRRQVAGDPISGFEVRAIFTTLAAVLSGAAKPELVYALIPTSVEGQSLRRFSVMMQLRAELAGAFRDPALILDSIERADRDGALIDLVWLDGCPLLDEARGSPRFAAVRESVSGRAEQVVNAFGL